MVDKHVLRLSAGEVCVPVLAGTLPAMKAGRAPRGSPMAGPEYQIEVINSSAALAALRPEWDALLEQAGINHPFLTIEWVLTWWECFGAGRELRVLVLRSAGEVVAIAPLMLSRERMYGVGVRRLGSLYNFHTPCCDVIVAPSAGRAACRAIWDRFAADQGDWDVLELAQFPRHGGALDQFHGFAADAGFRTGFWSARPSPFLELSGSWEDYLGQLDRKHRANLNNRMRRFTRLGRVEREVVSSGAEVADALEQGFRIEAAAWKGRAGTSIASLPDQRRFYSRLAERMALRGWLRLEFLRVDNRRVAFAYSLQYRNRIYLLKPGYDPEFRAYSPSNQLLAMTLQAAYQQRIAAYEFLGVDDDWKLEWTRGLRPHAWLHVFPGTPRGAFLYFTKFQMLPRLRLLQRKARAW